MTIHCADCGTEAAAMLGHEAGVRDPDLVDARVWCCPVCPEAWAPHEPAPGHPVALPAGPDTRRAREILRAEQVERLVREALRTCPGARTIAEDRIAGFLAHALGLPREEAAVERFSLDQCREAWRALLRASYADVVAHAQRHRGVKGRAA